MIISVERDILEANDRVAARNRALFDQHGVRVLNLMSSPGAGKTSLLEQSLRVLTPELQIGVIEGDIQSDLDAERIANTGAPVIQINTGGACHLDGTMIWETLDQFDLAALDLLVVENVGNLVCPAEFAIGEDHKVMILSVTEGDDKPTKYPLMFRESTVLLINKVDLLSHVDCSVERIERDAHRLNPAIETYRVSCKTGEGLDGWYRWLRQQVQMTRGERVRTRVRARP